MTKGNHLGDAYATTITRIKAQKGSRSRIGMEALMWVSNSERPLHTTEICHALGARIGSADLDLENVPTIRTLLACSLGLIRVEESSSTVRLVHFSLQEYLSHNLSLFQSPHSMIAEVCLTYLNFRRVRELSPTLASAPSTVPFAQYASGYWGEHMRRGGAGNMSPFALELLIEFEQHVSSQLLLVRYYEEVRWWEPRFDNSDGPRGFTGLHGAAFFGMVETVATLLAMREWDINATDARGRTALAWAAAGGHEDVVAMILQQKGAKANTRDTEYGLTPLWLAAAYGNEGVVKLLEREDVNPNTTHTECGWTPLLLAVENGCEGMARLLLERGEIDPNIADIKYGQTPLLWAARGGYERVVRLLLKRGDTNPNTADRYGWVPLMCAAQGGHEGVVRLLLERDDINPNTSDTEYGWTPLLWAVDCGYEGIVDLLLERDDVNPGIPNPNGQTALQLAVSRGHTRVAELLSASKPSFPVAEDIDAAPNHFLPDPSDLLQSLSQPPRRFRFRHLNPFRRIPNPSSAGRSAFS